MNKKEIN